MLHCKAILGRGQPGLNGMNFVMNHALGAGSIARPVDQQSSALACYGHTLLIQILAMSLL